MVYADKYGTVTLISRCLVRALERAFRVVFQNSVMGRDVLFVDLKIKRSDFCTGMNAAVGGEGRDDSVCVLRVANTHLDWATEDEAVARAVQLKEVHKVLFTQGVYVDIVRGDMSVTDPEDEALAEKVGGVFFLKISRKGGGRNDRSGGQTWGVTSQSSLQLSLSGSIRFWRVGICWGWRLWDGCDIELDGNSIWVSDHHGLMWIVRLDPA